MFFTYAVVAASGFATLSNAHLLLDSPKRFDSPVYPDNGPVEKSGSNFPCRAPAGTVYSGTPNVMALGSTQPLRFQGSAVHGGGSCQVSITYDTSPTKNSVWKVIHSYIGGCPAKDTPGNLPANPNAKVPFDYSFGIPADIPAGNGTLAWTWLNRIGNREFYMNCAPIVLEGQGGSQETFNALPNMVVANIDGVNSCTTKEELDYEFADPGKNVDRFNNGVVKIQTLGPECAIGGKSGGSPGGGAGGAPSPTAKPVTTTKAGGAGGGAGASPTTTLATSTKAAGPTVPGGVFIETSTSVRSAPVASNTNVASTPAASPSAPAASPSTGSGGGSGAGGSAGAFAAGTTCSPEGQWNCIGGKSFQRCASGAWSAVQALSAGTSCTPGQSANIDIKASAHKHRRRGHRFSF